MDMNVIVFADKCKESAGHKGHFALYNCLVIGHTKYNGWCPWLPKNQAGWRRQVTPSLPCYRTRLWGFCLSFIVFDIRASIFPLYQQTEATLMCMEPSGMMRYGSLFITPFNNLPLNCNKVTIIVINELIVINCYN